MTKPKGIVRLSQILEKHSPVECFIRFSLNPGTAFSSSRSFDLSDLKAGALMVAEDWLFVPSAVVNDLFVYPEGKLKLADTLSSSTDKVKPFDKLYVTGEYMISFPLNLIKNGSVNPLQRFLQTFGDAWCPDPVLPDTWNFIQQNFVADNPSKSKFTLKADCRALD